MPLTLKSACSSTISTKPRLISVCSVCAAQQAHESVHKCSARLSLKKRNDLLLVLIQFAAFDLFQHSHLHGALRVADRRNVFARNPFLAQQEIQHLAVCARRGANRPFQRGFVDIER